MPAPVDSDALPRAPKLKIARNSLLNLAGVVVPALVALAAIPLLLSTLGPAAFGIFSIQLAVLILLSVNDLGISRAVLLVSIAGGGFSDAGLRERTARAGIELVLLLSLAVVLVAVAASLGQWLLLERSRGDLLWSWLLVGVAAAVALPSLPLRARLEIEERFGALNLLRSIGSSLLFLVPLLAVLVEPSLTAIALGHLLSRALVLAAYVAVAGAGLFRGLPAALGALARGFPALRGLPLHAELLRRGKWLGVGAVTQTLIAYVDRFALGLLGTAAAVAHYTVASELVTKMWLVIGALTAAAMPQIAAGWERRDESWRMPFRFLAASTCILAVGAHAVFSFAGEPILRLWLGAGFDSRMVSLLAILSVGIAVNCVAQMNFVLLLVAGGERRAAQLLFVTLALTALLSLAVTPRFGAEGVAWVFTARMLVDSLVVRYLTRSQAGRRDIGIPSWALLLVMLVSVAIFEAAAASRP